MRNNAPHSDQFQSGMETAGSHCFTGASCSGGRKTTMNYKEKFESRIGVNGIECSVDEDGRTVHTVHDDEHFDDLSIDNQELVTDWLLDNLIPRETELSERTSYGMKHILERHTGVYLTNNQFKEAMLRCGFYPTEVDALNWCFALSKRSPMFHECNDEVVRQRFSC